jgi:hypothetical protein
VGDHHRTIDGKTGLLTSTPPGTFTNAYRSGFLAHGYRSAQERLRGQRIGQMILFPGHVAKRYLAKLP